MNKFIKILLIGSVTFSLFSGPNEDLLDAARNGNLAGVEAAIAADADVNAIDNDGNTALMWAAFNGNIDIVRFLLDRGADANIINRLNNNVLMHAAQHGHTKIVELLLLAGIDVNIRGVNGYTALIFAVINGHTDTVKLLLDKGADINAVDDDKNTALIFAAQNGHIDVKLLLDRGADVNAINNCGSTALIMAARYGHIDIVKLLLNRGADINVVDNYGNTSLMSAVFNGHADTVRLLLDRGANIDHVNKTEFTALSFAKIMRRIEIEKMLTETSKIENQINFEISSQLDTGSELLSLIQQTHLSDWKLTFVVNYLLNKINTANELEISNIRKMLITIAKRFAFEFSRLVGFEIQAKYSDLSLPRELVIEYLLIPFLRKLAPGLNLNIQITMASGSQENFVNLVVHEYEELEKISV